ncbi:pyroglutamyl-peptidase I [Microbacterium mitrae]|uniref:pyroglutamyl-peptidase I n=1 Tax=Microbacterium mitrae TaxID=664640 RepID=UPI00164EDEAF|nr:pyroglutamyl-peptidase I [Microbacterium mitrae]
MTTILLTGFEPFGTDSENPSGDAVRLLASTWQGPEQLVTAVLPVTFDGAGARLRELIAEHSPDLIIATGLAGNRAALSFERVAVNLRDARIADNAGEQPIDTPVVPAAASALFATLPVKAMTAAVADAGVPAELSLSAGTFVCNDVMFQAIDAAGHARAGFIHLPWADGQKPAPAPTLPLAEIARGIEVAIRAALATTDDLTVVGGTIS